MEKQRINIVIGGRKYPLNIESGKEEIVREAVKRIENKVNAYRMRYANKDMQDILSIAILEVMLRLMELENKDEIKDILQELQMLDKQLGEYLISR